MTALVDVRHCRHEEMTASLADDSVDLVVTDPPYFRVKNLPWDRAWDSGDAFIAWIGTLAAEWRRILKPSGTLYVFASPEMAARVEVVVREHFRVIATPVWVKNANGARGAHTKYTGESRARLRAYFPATERVIVAEHKPAPGYKTRDDEVWAETFAPVRAYLCNERDRLGLTGEACNRLLGRSTSGGGMAGHYFGRTQWEIPTPEAYARLQASGGFERSYESLRAEYDALMPVFESRRRPFFAEPETFTDAWTFPTVPPNLRGRHPCAKPPEMAAHVVRASSRPGDLVFDGFAGGGPFLTEAVRAGRRAAGCDADEWWAGRTRRACEAIAAQVAPAAAAPAEDVLQAPAAPAPKRRAEQLDLFAAGGAA